MTKKEVLLQGRVIRPNQVLMDKLSEEKFNLARVDFHKAEAMDLWFASQIGQVKTPAVIKAIEERSDERTFELLLALVGYNKTNFKFREPISEEKFLLLLNNEIDEDIFYLLVYSDIEVKEINFLRDNVSLNFSILRKILAYANNTHRSESEIARAYVNNRSFLDSHRTRFRNNYKVFEKLDELALAFLPEISEKYKALVSSKRPKMSLLARIQRLVNHYVRGDISRKAFRDIFALRDNQHEIIPALNMALASSEVEE